MMNFKIVLPVFVALSLIVGACSNQAIETPDAVDGAVQEGIEGTEQGLEDAGNAVDEGLNNLDRGAGEAGNAAQDGLKNLEKGAGEAGNAAQDGLKEGLENTGNAVENLGEEIPSSEGE